jgi:hypothetical protein
VVLALGRTQRITSILVDQIDPVLSFAAMTKSL